jgi:hypothetical protein
MTTSITKNYSIGESFLRAAVFQNGGSFLECLIIKIYKMISQMTFFPKEFDLAKANGGLERFRRLGAHVSTLNPTGDRASITMMEIHSETLENNIKSWGGTWKRIEVKEEGGPKSILAIIPPETPSSEWDAHEGDLLGLRWKKQQITTTDGKTLSVIVTCENVELIAKENDHRKVFLNVPPPESSFVQQVEYAGFCLGMKQNYASFDPSGKGFSSERQASEATHYCDVAAVLDEVIKHHAIKDTWVTGTCGGSFLAAYAKSKYHKEGINLLTESGCVSLKEDWFNQQVWLVRQFANYFSTGLKNPEIASRNGVEEHLFDLRKMWENAPCNESGKVILVNIQDDPLLNANAASRLTELAKKVNKQVTSIEYTSRGNNHSDFFFRYALPTRKVIAQIFQ